MDDGGAAPYVGGVTLLLLLSAMLSALTGTGVGARAPVAAVAVNRVAAVSAVRRVAAVVVAGRPAVALPELIDVAEGAATPCWRLSPAALLYFGRRRE